MPGSSLFAVTKLLMGNDGRPHWEKQGWIKITDAWAGLNGYNGSAYKLAAFD